MSAVMCLSGCQWAVQPPAPSVVGEARIWSQQGHWIQTVDSLEQQAQQLSDNPALYRVLGEAYWRLGIQAMASYAALQPDAAELESLGKQVFELEAWLDENTQGSFDAREYDRFALGAIGVGGFDSGGWVVDDTGSLE